MYREGILLREFEEEMNGSRDITRKIGIRAYPEVSRNLPGKDYMQGMGVNYENSNEDPDPVAGVRCTGLHTGNGGNDRNLCVWRPERDRCIAMQGFY